MKGKLLKRMCVVALSALMLAGVGATGAVPFVDTAVTVSAAETTADGNFAYEVNEDGGVTIIRYTGSDTEVVIPSTINSKKVTSIGYGAFYSCESLTSVTIPDSVTSIGREALCGCTSLTSVTIPDSVTSIGYWAFRGCKGLADKNGFVVVRNILYDYYGNDSEITIPDSVTSIGDWAFSDCTRLTSVTIPDSVTSIGRYAFSYCTSLTSVTIPDSVTSIGYEAFHNCTSLTSVTIPDSVTSIGDGAFRDCTSLTSVTILNGVTSIGNEAFSHCTSLTSVTIPDSVTSIGDWAFRGCESLTSVTIPDSVTSIGNRAFYECESLTSVTIPDSVTSIGDEAFHGCKGLADKNGFVVVRNILYNYYGNDSEITIPDSVTTIGYDAFYGCSSLTSVTIPDSVTNIGDYAFFYCTSLTSVTIPDSVTSIGDYAFLGCTSLTSVTIANGVTSIGTAAFYGCENVTIKGKSGSYAETYAESEKIPFVAVTFPLSNTSKLSADSVILGKSITVNCAAKEGTAPYTYAVYYRKAGTTKWSTVQGYKANSIVTITPKAAVAYEVRVAVKDANGKIARKDMTLAVKKPFTNTSKLSADTIKPGEKVKVRCFAENGEKPYTFSVQYKKSSSTKWTNVAVNSTNNIFVLKPGAATNYDILVTAKSPDGQVSKKTLTLTVTK